MTGRVALRSTDGEIVAAQGASEDGMTPSADTPPPLALVEIGPTPRDGAAPGDGSLRYEVGAFLAALPRKQREALVQRMFSHLSYSEIAGNLCWSEAAARASVYTTLRALRNHFGDRL
jgi:DNA-directed RNA polymerase specialized sigma24 family protein